MKPKDRVKEIVSFFDDYKKASNAATGAKYDQNANVTTKNIATMQAESIKKLGIDVQRYVAYEYIKKCFDEDLAEQYIKDLEHHTIYTNDESTLGGYPYCAAISLYPFLLNGLKDLGGSSGPPKHTNGYIGGLINLIFLVAGQLAGACMYKDQKILIKHGGKPYVLSSEELFSKFSLGREISKFTTLTDIWEYVDISDLGVEIYENDVWVPLRKVMRRAYKGEIYHLSTKGGREVFVSKDHRFKHFYRQRVFETRAEDLMIGDTIAADVEFSNIIDTSSDDYKIGQIVGLIAGDGNITDSYVRISINSDQSFIADFLDENIHLLNIPEISHARIPDKRGQVFTYYVGSTRAADIIKGFFTPEGYSTYTKNVSLEGRSLDWQFGFLDGLLTADGSYSPRHCLRISLTNFSLIQTVRKILNNLFFDAKISEYVPKKENKHTLYSTHIPMRALSFLDLVKKKPCYSGVATYNSRPKHLNTKTPYYAGTTYGIVSAQNVTSVREHKKPGMRSDVVENIATFLNDHPYVYEVETETHWYNCGGLITHNCAVPETLVYMDHFLRLDFGQDYTDHLDDDNGALRHRIEDWFQQFVYSINQPAGSRNYQSPFTNISYYDKYYFASIFRDFVFPDGDEPCWETTKELQKMFMKWFNKERTREVLTFPVETMNLLWDPETKEYKDQEMADFTAEMWAEGHSFFLYNSDSADALSSCLILGTVDSNIY